MRTGKSCADGGSARSRSSSDALSDAAAAAGAKLERKRKRSKVANRGASACALLLLLQQSANGKVGEGTMCVQINVHLDCLLKRGSESPAQYAF